jgi:hypothetical protein
MALAARPAPLLCGCESMSFPTLFGFFFAALGAVFLGIAIYQAWQPNTRGRYASKAIGIVVANEPEHGSDGIYFASVVRFKTGDGREIDVDSHVVSQPPAHAIGDRVSVSYDPADPQNARLETFSERWFLPAILGVLGSVFSAVGFAVAFLG